MNDKLYQIKRNFVKRKLTGNLGKVVETEDNLICYVKKNKCRKDKCDYTIACSGIKNKILATFYNLDKPIIYIIDSLEFKKNVFIWGNNCEVIIKNCKFNLGAYIRIAGKCTFENDDIIDFSFLNIDADNLTIKNMNIINQLPYSVKNYIICIGADENIEINNSTIGDNTSHVYIITKNKLEVYNSEIIGKTVTCRAKNAIFGKHSSIKSKEKTELEIHNFYDINITSPTIICNSNTFETQKTPINLKQIPNSLIDKRQEAIKLLNSKRLELIQALNKVKNKANNSNKAALNEYESILNNKPISKVLSK